MPIESIIPNVHNPSTARQDAVSTINTIYQDTGGREGLPPRVQIASEVRRLANPDETRSYNDALRNIAHGLENLGELAYDEEGVPLDVVVLADEILFSDEEGHSQQNDKGQYRAIRDTSRLLGDTDTTSGKSWVVEDGSGAHDTYFPLKNRHQFQGTDGNTYELARLYRLQTGTKKYEYAEMDVTERYSTALVAIRIDRPTEVLH